MITAHLKVHAPLLLILKILLSLAFWQVVAEDLPLLITCAPLIQIVKLPMDHHTILAILEMPTVSTLALVHLIMIVLALVPHIACMTAVTLLIDVDTAEMIVAAHLPTLIATMDIAHKHNPVTAQVHLQVSILAIGPVQPIHNALVVVILAMRVAVLHVCLWIQIS